MPEIEIAGNRIGTGHPCFIIAEAGVNHNGSLDLARALIDAAAAADADAVKFQTFKTRNVISATAPKAAYQQQTTDTKESQLEMVERLELPFEAFRELAAYCGERRVIFLSTPFDDESADFLAQLGVAAFKIPSGEITNLPLLRRIARKSRPMLVSTGMCHLGEVETAVRLFEECGNRDFALLHCVSNYPSAPADSNLRAMRTMAEAFGVPVGYSDHTLGGEVALAAVALGACVIEKHLTLDRALPGPDHRASLEPEAMAALVRGIRDVEAALGDGRKRPVASEANTASVARKSLVSARAIKAGEVVTESMVAIKRPGTGLPPASIELVIGRRARGEIAADRVLDLTMFE